MEEESNTSLGIMLMLMFAGVILVGCMVTTLILVVLGYWAT